MFVPISDDNPLRSIRQQYVTIGLIAVNIIVYLLEVTGQGQAVAASFAIVPKELLDVRVIGGPANGQYDALPVPEWLTLITYAYLHGDPLHLGANMLFLWVFGDNVEDAVGHLRFFVFYTLCGIGGALAHTLMATNAAVPLIGASGSVAGIIAAYLLLHPHVRVWVLAFRVIPLRITAGLALGAWVLTQFVMLAIPDVGPVAWWAHIGGLVVGALLILVMRRPGVALLDRPAGTAQ